MTNSLLIYEESGYLFNDMTKRLEWFEIDKILISFTYGVVRYIGTWGGGRTDKVLEVERLYSSEECFKKGDSIPKRNNNFLEQAEGYPVDVDLETEGFYRCNDANDIAGSCADFIFHKYND